MLHKRYINSPNMGCPYQRNSWLLYVWATSRVTPPNAERNDVTVPFGFLEKSNLNFFNGRYFLNPINLGYPWMPWFHSLTQTFLRCLYISVNRRLIIFYVFVSVVENTEGLLKRTNLFQLIGYREKALSSILSGRTARNLWVRGLVKENLKIMSNCTT